MAYKTGVVLIRSMMSELTQSGTHIQAARSRHAAVLDPQVEQARVDADIGGGLNARQATPKVRRLRARKGIDQLDYSWIERRHWTEPSAARRRKYASHSV